RVRVSRVNPDSAPQHMSPVNPEQFVYVASFLVAFGLFFACWLFVFEAGSEVKTRNNVKALLICVFAAAFLGVGGLFTFLSVGIYV
ncbi:Transmembrane protein, partial [Orchesella cincta]